LPEKNRPLETGFPERQLFTGPKTPGNVLICSREFKLLLQLIYRQFTLDTEKY